MLDRVREDLDSYRGALAWLIEHKRASEAIDIAWALMFFWVIRGHTVEGLRWYQHTLNLPSLTPAAESRALLGAAAMRYTQGEHQHAREELTQARALAAGADDSEMIAQADYLWGHVEYALGHFDAAYARFARSVDVFSTLPSPWAPAMRMTGMAESALANGDDSQAERLLDRAEPLLRNAGQWFQVWAKRASLFLPCGPATRITRSA